MNYFELLNVPQRFQLDDAVLQAAYVAAQRQCHPDKFVRASLLEKETAQTKSAAINQALNILKDPLKRTQHLLELVGVDTHVLKPSPALVMEIMDLQESGADVRGLIATCETELAQAFEKNDIPRAKDLANRYSYLYKLAGQSF